jgi:serine protease Do
MASGNPFNLAHTITAGIVSATGRASVGIADYEDFIQTDAAINPGNSGGPLLNLSGEVVGINTAIFTRTGGYAGIGFAIPINMAKTVMRSLIDQGKVVRGWLGVSIQPLNEELAQSFGYEGSQGILVGDVTVGGPAERAGLKPGDIILEMAGQPVTTIHQLRHAVAATPPGTTTHFALFRDGKRTELDVKIGEQEAEPLARGDKTREMDPDWGMTVETLTPQVARQLGEEDLRGVVVTRVEPWGAADKAGLRARDVIVSVQGNRVADVSDLKEALARADLKRGARLVVRSGGAQRFVFLRANE